MGLFFDSISGHVMRLGVNIFIVLPLVAVLSQGFVGCRQKGPSAAAEEPRTTVFVEKVENESIREEILYPARVLSEVLASVKAPSSGRVMRVFRHVGDLVKQGAPLIELKNLDAGFDYSAVLVRAPVSGRVWQMDVSPGSELAIGDKIASVIDPLKLEVRVEVPAADVESLKASDTIELVKKDGASLKLEKAHLSPMVDLQTGTTTCILKVSSSEVGALVPGQLVTIKVLGPARESMMLPQDALKYRQGVPHVRVLQDTNVVSVRPVKIGLSRGGRVEILKGIEVGETVVVRSTKFVADGEVVSVFVADQSKLNPEKSIAR